ncbi:MAG TPA: CRISPR-associated endonuclease Cas2 [Spirochaetota bacterium]|nr:CRISPR-associated endonuclease Cas2 [Spirochaetota bacterium]HPL17273.1 CRISPR-associated endonuclease Cas2 [Spirochaetota bacterium]
MMVLVSYDVSTIDGLGRRRLRLVAKECVNHGIRVQKSVFECKVDPAKWELFKAKLLKIYNPGEDSLRFYFLGSNWKHRVEHHGVNAPVELDEPLIV